MTKISNINNIRKADLLFSIHSKNILPYVLKQNHKGVGTCGSGASVLHFRQKSERTLKKRKVFLRPT